MAFASPLCWQIRFLVQGLTKKNQQTCSEELNKLVALYGSDARVFLLTCLLEEVDFRETKTANQLKELPKLSLLTQEVHRAQGGANFVAALCQALESSSGRSGGRPLKIGEDNFFPNFTRACRISFEHQIEIGLGLLSSETSAVATAGAKLVKSKCQELVGAGSNDADGDLSNLSENTVFRVMHALHTHPELAAESQETLAFLRRSANPSVLSLVPMLTSSDSTSTMNLLGQQSSVLLQDHASLCDVDAAAFVRDLGYSATTSKEVLRVLLSEAGALPLSASSAARLMLMFSTTMSGVLESEMSPVLVNALLPEGVPQVPDLGEQGQQSDNGVAQHWNLDVVVEVLKGEVEASSLDQSILGRELDQPSDLSITDGLSLQHLVHLFTRVCGVPLFPVAQVVLSGLWANLESQISFLECAVAADADTISFSQATTSSEKAMLPLLPRFSEPTGLEMGGPANDAWLNPNLVRLLLAFGETPTLAERAHALANRAVLSCPETLALVLATHAEEAGFTGTRLHAALLKDLLPPYFSPQPVGTRAFVGALPLVQRMWAVNPSLVLRCCRQSYMAHPTAAVVQHLIKLVREVPNGGAALMDMPQRELVLAVACVLADRGELELDAWATEQLTGPSAVAATEAALSLVARHAANVLPRASMTTLSAPPVTLESLTSMLKVLDKCSSPVPEVAQRIEQHIGRTLQVQPALAPLFAPVSTTKPAAEASSVPAGAAGGAVDGSPATDISGVGAPASSDDIEEMANSYFQKIYTSEQSIAEVIEMLGRFKTSSNPREQEIFACMIHNLFDEYRFFHKYPEKELRITGILFGTLIQHQLVSSITLGIALRYVLEALRKPLWQNGKMFRFGMFALEQFKGRLGEWPQYCSHIVQIEHLQTNHAGLVEEIKLTMQATNGGAGMSSTPEPGSAEPSEGLPSSQQDAGAAAAAAAAAAPAAGLLPQPRPAQIAPVPRGSGLSSTEGDSLQPMPGMMQNLDKATAAGAAQAAASGSGGGGAAASSAGGVMTCPADRSLLIGDIMPAGTEPLSLLPPPDNIVERIHLVFNNVSLQNLDQKALETRGVLEADFLPWFGNYMVVKRISTQPNFHTLYMAFLLKLDAPELLVAVLSSVFHNVSMLLASQKITTSTSERSLLKNLGSWLGQMTLARNKPILQRKLDVKELLCQGFETGRLIAVTPFVAKIMEGAKDSRVFRPPNPWVMSLMGVLRELYDMEELKMNIKFEIEVLCKHLGLKIDDVSPARVLCGRLQPRKDKTPDFNVRPSALSASMAAANTAEEQSRSGTPQPAAGSASADAGVAAAGAAAAASGAGAGAAEAQQAAAAVAPVAGGGDGGSQQGEQTVIPNLGAYVTVNQMLPLFQQHPNLKSSVPIAVDRAIREIIQPAVERSVTIACITTKELVNKDFALEGNEQKMRKAAQLMVSNLAGSLAVVTCKEPLRLSMANTLRTLLVQQAAASLPANTQLDPAALEQAVQACSGDNLELGCMLIEKAATEAAIRDIDEALAVPLAERRKAAAQGQLFPKNDSVAGKRYPNALPEMLRPTRAGLGPQQLMVYEAFARQPRQPPTAGGSAPASAGAEGGGGSGGVSLMDAQQGMAMYGRLVTALEKSMEAVREQAGARASLLSLAVLGPEHEVSMLVRKALELTVKINLSEREAAAYQFARSIFFKKVVEEGDELLKLECYVGVLAGLKDECKKLTKDIVSWITYLSISDEIKCKQHRVVLMLLVRAKIIRMSDVDLSLAGRMNAGTSAELVAWVDFAMTFVSQCLLVERIGTWADFGNLFDQLGKAAQRPGQHTRKINKFMEDLRAANNSQQAGAGSQVQTSGEGIGGKVGAAAREQVTYLLERWIRVWNESGGAEQKCVQYIALLHQQNVLKTEEMTDVFLRVATELCVEACVKTAGPVVPSASSTASSSSEGAGGADSSVPAPTTQLAYTVVDAYSSLLVILVKYASADPQSVTSRVHLLGRILSILHRALLADMSEASSASKGGAQQQRPRQFDQRPYFRILVNLLRDLNTADPVVEQNNLQVLGAFAGAFHALQPSNAPAFAFAWLELISHRSFMPALLLAKPAQKGWMLMHRLLVALFSFMGPFLRRTQLPPAIRTLYRGTLRMVLVLLHDFPEFLCDYHLSFCDVIPANCIQLRNLFLSAFPRAMRLPDPFTPNLKVDLLPEISQHPRILSNIVASLTPNGLRTDLDSFLKQPSNKALQFLEWLPDRLRVAAPPSSSSAGPSSTSATSAYTYNVPAINSLVVYIGAQGIAHLQNKSLPHSPVMEIFQCLMLAFDAEGRYYLLNAIANQLRYPNNHTHYFSCVLLFLFAETSSEFVKEQITRVLLERLIVHRPHPWGLLITFIELIKNPRYNFWAHKFTHCATEIEKVFESVARSCMGPGHAAGGGGGGAVEGGGGTDSTTPAGSS